MATPIRVFFAYAQQDQSLRDEFAAHLTYLQLRGAIADWRDRRLGDEDAWGARVSEHLKGAQVVLFLISPHFLGSAYCMSMEVTWALAEHAAGTMRVLPVILRECSWNQAPFSGFVPVPRDGRPVTAKADRNEAWTVVMRELRKAVDEMAVIRRGGAAPRPPGKEPAPQVVLPAVTEWIASAVEAQQAQAPVTRGDLELSLEAARLEDDVAEVAALAQRLGDLHADRGRHYDARTHYEEALASFGRAGDACGAAGTLERLGEVSLWLGQPGEARVRFEDALRSYRRGADLGGEARCLEALARTALRGGDLPLSQGLFERALAMHRQGGDVAGQAACLGALGDLAMWVRPVSGEGRPREGAAGGFVGPGRAPEIGEARQRFEQALPLYREARDVAGEARCRRRLGDLALEQGLIEEAVARYGDALALYRQIKEEAGAVYCLRRLGDLAVVQEQFGEAQQRYQDAKDVVGEASCLKRQGDLALDRAKPHMAILHYEQALERFREAGDPVGDAACLVGLAEAALDRGEDEDAVLRYHQALPIYRELCDASGEAGCLERLGDLTLDQGKPEDARWWYERALARAREASDELREANALLGLGNLSLALSRTEDAARSYELARGIYRRSRDVLGEANCSKRLGDVARREGRFADAQAAFELALSLYTSVPAPYSIGQTHRRLAKVAPSVDERRQHLEMASAAWLSIERADLIAALHQEFPEDT
ncbi:toll/interleukin-1 receptor domain-containing protein [Chondromyces crocatus]|uniref:TIR domain-containing protein n=1 Tax=Chondromyces crocatus TaxID=52 RepID=A0A0K1E884_CHOCO|nr:toll/interleukin-1 receptor domain-containing protein [Chondromyces crocatus]AKT37081.1 uncharacterized protein CMC5_012070 [Chondromyces crocatus]